MAASMCIVGGSRSLREMSDARVLLRVLLKQTSISLKQTSKSAGGFDVKCCLRWRHV